MNEMTLPSRHRLRNSCHDSLRPSTLPHNIESLRVTGEEIFYFSGTLRPEWGSNPRSPTFQAGSFNHCTRTPAYQSVGLVQLIENTILIKDSK